MNTIRNIKKHGMILGSYAVQPFVMAAAATERTARKVRKNYSDRAQLVDQHLTDKELARASAHDIQE